MPFLGYKVTQAAVAESSFPLGASEVMEIRIQVCLSGAQTLSPSHGGALPSQCPKKPPTPYHCNQIVQCALHLLGFLQVLPFSNFHVNILSSELHT